MAEDWVRREGLAGFADREARWRTRPATKRQIAWLVRRRVRVGDGLTKAEAADLMARLRRRSARR